MAYPRHNVTIVLEIASLCMALICGCVLGWAMFGPETNYLVLTISGALFTAFLLITIALILDPDRIRANQSMSVLNLASATLEAMQEGFTSEAAQKVCEIHAPFHFGMCCCHHRPRSGFWATLALAGKSWVNWAGISARLARSALCRMAKPVCCARSLKWACLFP